MFGSIIWNGWSKGIANSELTGELAYKLGQAGAYVLTVKQNIPRKF